MCDRQSLEDGGGKGRYGGRERERARTPALSRARLTHIHTLRALSSSARALSRKRSGKYMLTCMRAHMRDTRQEDKREGGGGGESEKSGMRRRE